MNDELDKLKPIGPDSWKKSKRKTTEEEDIAFAEDWDRELLGDDYLILEDEDIGNK